MLALLPILVLAAPVAAQDMYGWEEARGPITTEQQRQRDRAIAIRARTQQCDGLRQQLVAHTSERINTIYRSSYDMADRGWVQHNSREIFMRDVRWEIARAEEEMRRLAYQGDVDVVRCEAVAVRYRGFVGCYFSNAMNNEPRRNRTDCGSRLYESYVAPAATTRPIEAKSRPGGRYQGSIGVVQRYPFPLNSGQLQSLLHSKKRN